MRSEELETTRWLLLAASSRAMAAARSTLRVQPPLSSSKRESPNLPDMPRPAVKKHDEMLHRRKDGMYNCRPARNPTATKKGV